MKTCQCKRRYNSGVCDCCDAVIERLRVENERLASDNAGYKEGNEILADIAGAQLSAINDLTAKNDGLLQDLHGRDVEIERLTAESEGLRTIIKTIASWPEMDEYQRALEGLVMAARDTEREME